MPFDAAPGPGFGPGPKPVRRRFALLVPAAVLSPLGTSAAWWPFHALGLSPVGFWTAFLLWLPFDVLAAWLLWRRVGAAERRS